MSLPSREFNFQVMQLWASLVMHSCSLRGPWQTYGACGTRGPHQREAEGCTLTGLRRGSGNVGAAAAMAGPGAGHSVLHKSRVCCAQGLLHGLGVGRFGTNPSAAAGILQQPAESLKCRPQPCSAAPSRSAPRRPALGAWRARRMIGRGYLPLRLPTRLGGPRQRADPPAPHWVRAAAGRAAPSARSLRRRRP
jgi:hypothetical protein